MKRSIKRLFYANKGRVIVYLLAMLLFLLSLSFFSVSILRLNGIETLLRILILLFLIIFFVLLVYKGYKYVIRRNKIKYFIVIIVSVIISIILIIITYFVNVLYGGIGNLTLQDSSYYTGYLISLKNTNKDNISTLGRISDTNDNEGYIISEHIIKDEKLDNKIISYDTYEDMLYDLYNSKIDGAFVQSNYVSYFSNDENYKDIENKIKIIYKKTMKLENKNNILASNKKLDEPFTVLLMGVDSTLNSINTNTAFNGDTLMLITFNPKTLNATIFSIPRDLYVPITCRNNGKAKINSSSVGGVSCVIDTIENLVDIKIDYYSKINFKGVVDLVNALGGIDVNVTYSFCEQDSNRDYGNQICLDEGYQHLNGEQALAFARHRHSLPTGDLTRIQNQQLIVEALAQKALSLNTITDFKDIMAAISNNIVTNMSTDQILSSYNILKSMVLNVITDKDALVVEKAYLEVYDMNIYNETYGTYSQSLGYYEDSLKDIEKTMKINLGIEKPELITDFSFDANTIYEQKIAGKGIKNNVSVSKVIDFSGKSVSDVEAWGTQNNITINKEYVSLGDEHYNESVLIGLVGNQSVSAGTSLNGVNSITIYINTVS